MKTFRHTIILHPEPEEGGYSVTEPALPGCFTQGETVEESVERAREAIALHIDGVSAEGLPEPDEQEHPQAMIVEVAA